MWLPFLAKCSCTFDSTVLSFMSVCICVLGYAPKFSINLLISAHPLFLPWYSCMVYILLQTVYIPFCTLHSLYTMFLVIAEPKSHTKIHITFTGKYFNLLSMHIMSNITSSSGLVSKQHITKWMGGRDRNLFGNQAESQMCHK